MAMALALSLYPGHEAQAFPGLCVASSQVRCGLETTHLVVMQQANVSVVTTMVDYRGPQLPFALVLPVPDDVTLARLETVKHEFVARLEEVTAPRFIEFWEKDPCASGPAEQEWEARVPVRGRGFLTPKVLPPADAHYPISNELSQPSRPIFKGVESEFTYQLLSPRTVEQVSVWLERRGYTLAAPERAALTRLVERRAKLLIAQVAIEHVELVAAQHLQLAGIRYWTEKPLPPVNSTLGRPNGSSKHDLFVYALHRQQRFLVTNYANVFAPTNLGIQPELGTKLGVLYNAAFDLQAQQAPRAFVTEYVGGTDTCGEPCPNAPLHLRELLTLGGDVLEAKTVTRAEREPGPAPESEVERQRFEATLANLAPPEQARARREHESYLTQLGKRRSLLARQRYVLTRLHYRFGHDELPSDIELGAASRPIRGGYGVPRGPGAQLDSGVRHGSPSAFQVRFFATHAWQGTTPCKEPVRWRWGKRWKSHSQEWRKVLAARDLPRLGRDVETLKAGLATAVPALGLVPRAPPKPQAPQPPFVSPPEPADGCSVVGGRNPRSSGWLGCLLLVGLCRRPSRGRLAQ